MRYTNGFFPRRRTKRTGLYRPLPSVPIECLMTARPSRRSHRERNMGGRVDRRSCPATTVRFDERRILYLWGMKIEEESKTGRKSRPWSSINDVCICVCVRVCVYVYPPWFVIYICIYIKFVYIYIYMCVLLYFFNPRRISFFFISFRQLSINK